MHSWHVYSSTRPVVRVNINRLQDLDRPSARYCQCHVPTQRPNPRTASCTRYNSYPTTFQIRGYSLGLAREFADSAIWLSTRFREAPLSGCTAQSSLLHWCTSRRWLLPHGRQGLATHKARFGASRHILGCCEVRMQAPLSCTLEPGRCWQGG